MPIPLKLLKFQSIDLKNQICSSLSAPPSPPPKIKNKNKNKNKNKKTNEQIKNGIEIHHSRVRFEEMNSSLEHTGFKSLCQNSYAKDWLAFYMFQLGREET